MTGRCSPGPRRAALRRRCAPRALPAALAAVALASCGAPAADDAGPRAAVAALLARLAGGDERGICRSLTASAAADLRRDVGGSTCAATAAAAARHVATVPGLRAAVRDVAILPTLDVPLSPAPVRAGAQTAAVRVVIDDPVLGSRQALDLRLRMQRGRWRVDDGVGALFTIVRPRRAAGG